VRKIQVERGFMRISFAVTTQTCVNDSWNDMQAEAFAALFIENGNMMGFDGSLANGKQEIFFHLPSTLIELSIYSVYAIPK
jgi:uncharacterized protein (TIGR02246 family)